MTIWAIADLHLSFGVPDKKMDVFGNQWQNHPDKIQKNWERLVRTDDLVLVAGDISWGMHSEEVQHDLDWIERLPGTKVFVKGNHDYWWTSLSKAEKIAPPSIHLIQNNAFCWQGFGICGSRMWDSDEYSFDDYIDYFETSEAKKIVHIDQHQDDKKIFERELHRLEMSLKALPANVHTRIAMIHYPPISAEMQPSRVSALLEKYKIQYCVFGHIHSVRRHALPFGVKNGVRYILTAADYLDFCPIKIV